MHRRTGLFAILLVVATSCTPHFTEGTVSDIYRQDDGLCAHPDIDSIAIKTCLEPGGDDYVSIGGVLSSGSARLAGASYGYEIRRDAEVIKSGRSNSTVPARPISPGGNFSRAIYIHIDGYPDWEEGTYEIKITHAGKSGTTEIVVME